MKRYRKKPVVIEAVQLTKDNIYTVAEWCGGRVIEIVSPRDTKDVYVGLDIPTLEGAMRAETFHQSTWDGSKYTGGDYIIRGIKGEFYPCKPDVFTATYEEEK